MPTWPGRSTWPLCAPNLTAVVDVASRRVLAHRVAITLEAIHAKEVLDQAVLRYGCPEIVSTDQGSQFTAEE